jgi:hypothetical protein
MSDMPTHVKAICDAYVAAVPVPSGGPNPADEAFENRARAWTRGLAQQIVYSTGDRSWGCKNAGGGRPQSKDAIAQQVGGRLIGYDMMFGVGTGSPAYNNDPASMDITGQTFMAVEPFDHIGAGGGGDTGGGGGGGDSETDARQDQQIAQLQQQVASLNEALVALASNALTYGSQIGLRAWGHPEEGKEGKVLCAESGGPERDQIQFVLTSRSGVGPWETWKVERGQ